MSNKKNEREAKQQWQAADSAAVSAAQQVKLSPQAEEALQGEYAKYKRIQSGDYNGLPEVSRYLGLRAQQRQARERQTPTGVFGMAQNYNDDVIQMQKRQMDREDANETGRDVAGIVGDVAQNSLSNVAGFSGMDLGARSTLAGLMMGRTGMYQQNYINERNRKGFWGEFAKSLVAGASQVGSAMAGGG